MSDTVWVSNAMNDSRLTKPLMTDLEELDNGSAADLRSRNYAGESLKASDFPKQVFPISWERYVVGKLPHLILAGSYCVVDKPVADVLRQFDMGEGALYPVKIFQKDRMTQVNGDYFCINFGNVKQAFLPEMSPKTMEFPQERRTLAFVPKDDDVAVSTVALIGPDLWVDPKLFKSFFVSGRLGSALRKAKLDGAFRLFNCRIIASS